MNDKPTVLTAKDIENFVKYLMDYEIKMLICWNCSKEFLPSYDQYECDECYFSRFPKEEVEKFYRSFLE